MKLKISKKLQSIILPATQPGVLASPFAGSASIQNLIREQWASGGLDKAGAVSINVTEQEAELLAGFANERLTVLTATLDACTTDEEKKPHFGEHSSLSALLRNVKKEDVKDLA